ncbi:alkanesulfonate monooxygenase [Xaviernesmea oryzae]|uniref:Alkanesulfonate monooxygenase n=1 Tax=Xaviernesmea oryzae TaxID=464029 RepID=A0A1X7DUI8_9HYPH|nr:LLM class flavin-dependent oxidoreductase [Xaviernesmea oryzae]SMF22074.1 alkanesulfonate monooxygenase [Xaviernesmea oryzae]
MSDRQLKIGLSLVSNGTHPAGWRLPEARADAALDFSLWKEMAQAAEQAKIHFIFLADGIAVRTAASDDDALSYSGRIDQFEPLTLIAGLAASTQKIGYIATASTTYNEPFHIARKFASLDFISGGRVGWNVVTSWSEAEAKNFSRDKHLEHSIRYGRAEEFVDVVRGLWDSWEDDAFMRDKEGGRYFDPAKMHVLNHAGEDFSVRGPLNIARPPQGYPVIAQAGSSEPGQELAARTADLIYTAKQKPDDARAFYRSVKGRFGKYGRSVDSALVMPGIMPVIGRTMEEAQAKYQRIQELIHPKVGLAMLARTFGDLSGYPLDAPLPDNLPTLDGVKSHREPLLRMARENNLTIRQLYMRVTGAAGHLQLCGTPESIADTMEEWFNAGACDGFNIMAPYFPDGLYEFLDQVVPVLQKRGLFRMDYEGNTLRENLGLARPEHPAARIRRSA